jgi:cytochrome c-type biogenesis protein CcmH
MLARLLLVLCVGLFVSTSPLQSLAVEPDEVLSDPALESRARALSKTLRCMVCQNQSIDDSNAPLARDLRILVRERLKSGDSDAQVREYLVARYGEFVLLEPRISERTIALWAAPGLVLVLGLLGVARWMRRRAPAVPSALSAEEKQRLSQLTDK